MFPEKPLSMRLHERFHPPAPAFGSVVPGADLALPEIASVDPVGHITEPPFRAPSLSEAVDAIRKAMVDVEDDSPERTALLSDFLRLSERIETFFTATKESRRENLTAELARIAEQGRSCLAELNEARGEAGRLQALWNGQQANASQARANLTALRNSRPADDSWPTPNEIREWESQVADATAEAERWRVAGNELMTALDTANAKVRNLERRQAELRGRREDLRAELGGKPRRGPYGLEIPAGK